MKAWRHILCRILIVALLAHAAAVVRHHIIMLSATADAAVTASASPICHGVTKAGEDKTKPGTVRKSCPICSGLAVAFSLPAPQPAVQSSMTEAGPLAVTMAEARPVTRHKHDRPPGRGPPTA